MALDDKEHEAVKAAALEAARLVSEQTLEAARGRKEAAIEAAVKTARTVAEEVVAEAAKNNLTRDDVRTIVKDVVEQHLWTKDQLQHMIKQSVSEGMVRLGIISDTDGEVVETQKDMAFVRKMRKGTDSGWTKAFGVLITTLLTGALALLWLGLNAVLHRGGQ